MLWPENDATHNSNIKFNRTSNKNWFPRGIPGLGQLVGIYCAQNPSAADKKTGRK